MTNPHARTPARSAGAARLAALLIAVAVPSAAAEDAPAKAPSAARPDPPPACACEAPGGGRKVESVRGRYTREVVGYRMPDVALLDADGGRVPLASVLDRDGPVAVQFFFTTCPTICGPLSGGLAAIQESPGADLAVLRFVSISIDPEQDRPEQLRRYAKAFGAGPRWRFYSGSRDAIAAVQKAFDAYQVNKMGHQPLTFLRPRPDAPWIRLAGILSAADLKEECRRMIRP